jgi:uridine kinase
MEKSLPQIERSKYKMPPVVSAVSKSKSGKTTVIERMAQEFGEVFFPDNAGICLQIA